MYCIQAWYLELIPYPLQIPGYSVIRVKSDDWYLMLIIDYFMIVITKTPYKV